MIMRNVKLPNNWMGSVCLWFIRVYRYIRNWMHDNKNGIQKFTIVLIGSTIFVFCLPLIVLLITLCIAVVVMLFVCACIDSK